MNLKILSSTCLFSSYTIGMLSVDGIVRLYWSATSWMGRPIYSLLEMNWCISNKFHSDFYLCVGYIIIWVLAWFSAEIVRSLVLNHFLFTCQSFYFWCRVIILKIEKESCLMIGIFQNLEQQSHLKYAFFFPCHFSNMFFIIFLCLIYKDQ